MYETYTQTCKNPAIQQAAFPGAKHTYISRYATSNLHYDINIHLLQETTVKCLV